MVLTNYGFQVFVYLSLQQYLWVLVQQYILYRLLPNTQIKTIHLTDLGNSLFVYKVRRKGTIHPENKLLYFLKRVKSSFLTVLTIYYTIPSLISK